MDEKEYSLVEHLGELRTRLGRALIGIAVIACAAFAVSDQLLEVLRQPMQAILTEVHGPAAKFIVVGAAEYLVCQMKAALVAGLFIASPWVLYQVWLFVAPGLYDHERRYVMSFVWAGAFFFCAGGAFCYFAVFPSMFRYLVSTLPADIALLPSLEEHFSFTLKMLVGFGVAFQTPVVIFILSLAGIVDPNSLNKYRKHVTVISLVVGAILTPTPDPLSMFLLAGPLFVLFELGVLVSRLTLKFSGKPLDRKARAEAEAGGASADPKKPAL
ncbi:MAG: twin-arginine translocase subunit TatC [Deltaproteobacteria bacterium]|nr:twin-arginine translocase subunit TatC [Deltaproteobacteria bacterium]